MLTYKFNHKRWGSLEKNKEIILESEHIVISAHNGTLKMCYKEAASINLRVAQEIYLDRLRVSGGLAWPLLVDFTMIENISEEAKEFYSQDYTFRGLTAVAFLLNTPVQILIYNFYLAFYKPPVPFKAFACEEKAMDWLESFKLVRMN